MLQLPQTYKSLKTYFPKKNQYKIDKLIFSQVKPNFKTIILHFPVDRTIMSGYDEVQKLKCSRFLACYELKRLFCLERSLIKCQSLFSIRKSRQIHDMSNDWITYSKRYMFYDSILSYHV
jgi:hypothetical protein